MSLSDVFNIETGMPIDIDDLAQRMIKIFGIDLEPIYYETKEGLVKYTYADTKKSKSILQLIESRNLNHV
jgi:nucleoside-diphosphate-sugar epimerase